MNAARDQMNLFGGETTGADRVVSATYSSERVNNGVGPTSEVPPMPHIRRIEFPAARANDPQSSHDAAELHTASGARQCHIEIVVAAVRAFEGLTSAEIADRTGLERHEAARRLPDAEKAGAVRKGGARKCSISGKLVTTWWPAA
jgi:hypothetical protein